MKTKITPKTVYILFAALCSIAFAFFIPQLVFQYEDNRTKNYDIHYSSENMDLNMDSISIAEKLRDISSELTEVSYIYMKDDYSDSGMETKSEPDEIREKAVNDMVDVFLGSDYADLMEERYSNIEKAGGFRDYLINEVECYVTPVLVVRPNEKDYFLAWEMIINDEDTGNYLLMVDDSTGKILSLQIYKTALDFESLSERMESGEFSETFFNYYGITVNSISLLNNTHIYKYKINMTSKDSELDFINNFSVDFLLDVQDEGSIYFNNVDEQYMLYDFNDVLNDESED